MKKSDLTWLAKMALYGGMIFCGVAVIARFQGIASVYGFSPLTLLVVGIGLMVFDCAIKLEMK